MTILVDFGFLTGADIPTAYYRIGHPLYGIIGTAAIAPPDVFTDYSGRLMSMSVQRTSSRVAGPIVEYNAGTATLTLRNDDGVLDPTNLDYPAPGVAVRIRKVYAGVTYPVFSGFVSSWLPELRSPTNAVVNVTATDGMDGIAGYPRDAGAPVGAGENTGARVARILDTVGWPAGLRDIAVGDSVLQATTGEGDALTEIKEAVKAEAGEFYIDGGGVAVFRNRHSMFTDTQSTTSQATFGSNAAGGEIMYVGSPGVSYDRQQLVNLVRATRAGGVEQVVDDATSRDRYRDHPYEDSSLPLTTDADAASWARYVLRQDSEPEFRYTSIDLDARLRPDLVYPQVLGRQFGDRVTVVRRPPGVVDSREVLIRSIEHSWQPPDRWRTTWGLQPVDRFQVYVIGHPDMGRIGFNAIAY